MLRPLGEGRTFRAPPSRCRLKCQAGAVGCLPGKHEGIRHLTLQEEYMGTWDNKRRQCLQRNT